MSKSHSEFIEEVKELTKPKTIAERTHDALSDSVSSELDDGGKR